MSAADPSKTTAATPSRAPLPPRQGGEATWPTIHDGPPQPAGLDNWPTSPEEPRTRLHPIADLVVATILALVLLALGGLYVVGVIDSPGSQNGPAAPAPTSTSRTAPGNPFAP